MIAATVSVIATWEKPATTVAPTVFATHGTPSPLVVSSKTLPDAPGAIVSNAYASKIARAVPPNGQPSVCNCVKDVVGATLSHAPIATEVYGQPVSLAAP